MQPKNSSLMMKRQGSFKKNLGLNVNATPSMDSTSPIPSSNMIMQEMPQLQLQKKISNNLPTSEILLENPDAHDSLGHEPMLEPKIPSMELKELQVMIPKRKKVAIVEIPNPFNNQSISANYQKVGGMANEIPADIWQRGQRMVINAFHSSFTNKYSIKIEIFDKSNQPIGFLETEMHHNPGHYCFFCLDYCPENYKINKGINISRISPYCNCLPKTIYDYDNESLTKPKTLGHIKSNMCSGKVNITNDKGELVYGLKDGNGFMRNFRFLLEAPFVFFCIPYKLAICCCLDMFYAGKSNEIKLTDHRTGKQIVVGVTTNQVERANEWQEVIRNGEKINQYKGEEIFLCKQFEVNMPEDATDDEKKLIIGALIAEIPSTVDRCAC